MERLKQSKDDKKILYKKIIASTCITLFITLGCPEVKANEHQKWSEFIASSNSEITTKTNNISNISNKTASISNKINGDIQVSATEKNISNINEWKIKYEKSSKYTPIKELDFFLKFFSIEKEDFANKVKEIQREHHLKVDGIIGRKTSKILFLKYYFPELENIGYQGISDKMRQIHKEAPEGRIINNPSIYKEKPERKQVSEEDIMKLRYIIYQEMHKKHYEVNLFDKRVLWGYGDINYDAPVYPFINPEIKGVPDNLEDAKNLYGKLIKRIKGENGIIVGKDENGKFILVFYKNNKRFLTTYVSPGSKNRKTPVSNLHEVRRHDMYHRSKKYKNTAMSYAVWLSGGYFFHNGVTTGYGKSHGCIRMPMMYAKILYEETKDLKNMPFVFQPKVKFKKLELEDNGSQNSLEMGKVDK